MKLPLAPAILVALFVHGLGACASDAPTVPFTPAGDDGGAAASDGAPPEGTDSGNPTAGDTGAPGAGKDSGPTKGGIDGGTACILPDAWSQTPTCDACQVQYCCAVIQNCAADAACAAIYACQSNCYSGVGPDGGTLSSADDGGGSQEDVCAANCLAAGSMAAQNLFTPQDTCVNTTSCFTQCD
jgi:hypothetical protein